MNSQQILDKLYNWAQTKNFTAPYGILTGSHLSRKGTRYLSITFGYARTLDVTVEIYNRNFLVLRTSSNGSQVHKSLTSLETALADI
jgi:hypothetical protein